MELVFTLTLLTVFVIGISASTFLMMRPRRVAQDRLGKSSREEGTVRSRSGIWERIKEQVTRKASRQKWAKVTKLPMSLGDASTDRKMLHHAGYRTESSLITYKSARLASGIGFSLIFLFLTALIPMQPGVRLLAVGGLLLAGFILPKLVLRNLARRRQHRLRLSLPDALDLLVICVEAGMGLNHAMVKVAEEVAQTHPEISEELKLVNVELRAGRSRSEALRNFGERTGVDDIIALAAMLIQADRFGTSITRSLRVHSDALRTERIQRAEEAAAKTTIKLIFPLMFCIFPALLTVILGPAFLNLMNIFSETFAHTNK